MAAWETRRRCLVYENPILQLLEETIRTSAGQESPWTVVAIADGVALAPCHEDGSVTMIRQYRHAAGRWLWEFPAGRVEGGEDVLAAGKRELAEEVGLCAGRLEFLGCLHPLAGICRHQIHLLRAGDLEETAMAHEPFEEMEVVRLTRKELRRLVDAGDVTDGIALGLIQRLHLLET